MLAMFHGADATAAAPGHPATAFKSAVRGNTPRPPVFMAFDSLQKRQPNVAARAEKQFERKATGQMKQME